jgi:phasin family protein
MPMLDFESIDHYLAILRCNIIPSWPNGENDPMKAKTQKRRPVASASAGKTAAAAASPRQRRVVRRTIETATTAQAEAPPDSAGFGQENLTAMVHANTTLMKGIEAIGQEVFGYAQHSLESAMIAARAMIGARSLMDVIALNREFAQAALESWLVESARLSEIGIKATSEAFAPLGQQVEERKMGRPTVA